MRWNKFGNKFKTLSKRLGQFFVVSAPSGAGKTTLVNNLLRDFPDLVRSVSWTTRPQRPGETDDLDYHFTDEASFRERVRKNYFFEWEEVHGSFYGTPLPPLLECRQKGGDVILDIDTRGALNLKKAFPESCLIFLKPPSLEVLEKRLRDRHTEPEEAIRRRIENARRELKEKDKFDYVMVNDKLDRAYEELKKIVLQVRQKGE